MKQLKSETSLIAFNPPLEANIHPGITITCLERGGGKKERDEFQRYVGDADKLNTKFSISMNVPGTF